MWSSIIWNGTNSDYTYIYIQINAILMLWTKPKWIQNQHEWDIAVKNVIFTKKISYFYVNNAVALLLQFGRRWFSPTCDIQIAKMPLPQNHPIVYVTVPFMSVYKTPLITNIWTPINTGQFVQWPVYYKKC